MSDLLYNKALLRLAADATGAGHLPNPDAVGTAINPACGDKVTVELHFAEGHVDAVAHEVKACLFAQASASILGAGLTGAKPHDVEVLKARVLAMLEGETDPPAAPFDSYVAFAGAIDHPVRHRCVLLPIEAVLAAIENFRGRQ